MPIRRRRSGVPNQRRRGEILTILTCCVLVIPVLGQARGAAPLPSDPGEIVAIQDQGQVVFTNLNADEPSVVRSTSGRSPVRSGAPAGLGSILDATAHRYDLDPGLVREVAREESDFDPHSVSNKGALGVMQLMPGTARDLGVRHPFDAAENIDGGARYLKALLQRYDGNVPLTLAAYNAGPGSVDRYGGRVPPYAETQAYVKAITRRLKGRTHSSAVSRRVATPARHPVHAPPVVMAGQDSQGNPVFTNLE